MMLALYRSLTTLSGPLADLYLRHRMRHGKEDRERFGERLGHPGLPRPEGPLVWAHGASIGESLSLLPLIERLLEDDPGRHILVTTGTVTSARLMAERLPMGAFHQYVPIDRPAAVAPFLDHWRPQLALWVESDLWPNLVLGAQARGLPMALLQGRMSARSFARWRLVPGLIRPMLEGFALCLAQTRAQAARFEALGATSVKCLGNLKQAAAPLAADPAELAALEAALGERPRWLAASTHAGEEAAAGRLHARLAERWPGLLTIVAPRHPSRGGEVAAALAASGLRTARRSAGAAPGAEVDVYVVDTLGELGLLYRLAPVAFVGGSLVPHGGQNPLEPARLGCAVLVGPHTHNFAEVVEQLVAGGGGQQVADEAALGGAVAALLGDPEGRARRGEAAREMARSGGGVLDAVLAELGPLLPRSGAAKADAGA
jgi:3-deoxy-D-manno-octulosonic-acid transferase